MKKCSLLLLALLIGCATPPQAPTGPRVLGIVQVTAGQDAAVQWVRPDADTLRALDLTSIPAGLDVQVVPTTTPFFDAGGTRYLYSHLKVRNGKGSTLNSELKNVTFLALDNTTTLGDTAIVSMRNAAGAAITSVDVARSLRPTHRMQGASAVESLGADLQLFSESEISSFSSAFPWGFGVRHCLDVNCDAYDKTLPGNPALNQFDGRVTLAFKTPITTSANTPKSASMLYLVVADNTTNARVVQSSEEQLTGTVAGRSVVPAGFDLVKLPGSNLPGGTQLSNVRVAGTASTTTTTLLTRPSLTASNAVFQQGQAVTYAVSGSDPQSSTLTYTVAGGALPAGLNLNGSTGAVSGTPSSYGTSNVTWRVTNASGEFDEKTVTLSVTATPPSVTVENQSLTQGQSANFTVTASDSQNLTLTYSLTQGSPLPAGLSLDSSTGVVSGTPTTVGTTNVTFQVTNSGGGTASKAITITVNSASGSLDTTFGSGGKVTTPIGTSGEEAYALVMQPDGKLVAAGATFNGSNFDFALVRYNSNGTLDTTFGSGGKVTTPIGTSNDFAYALVMQPDGKLVAAGATYNGSNSDLALVRYNSNGSLDTTFGTSGKVTTPIGTSDDQAHALVMQPDGKLVAAGQASNGSNFDFALVRYNSNGTLDTTFGSGGKVTTPIGTSNDYAYALVMQPDGKLIAAGRTINGSTYDFALVRYNSNGSLDTTFGTSGKVTTAMSVYNDEVRALAVQPDGKLVAAGSGDGITLVRYQP
ncbi:putative Ig domain-containing protein [Deinococcus yavapaiensis]|uniref:Putative delta-60 repeat protein n=1 Tax=Deinococcus yavapaiensis KR-236 TaxID=694435 RepID=A0A318S2W6_9DEIO|nr:putative Ig domain-containing protein [Deinococcus yavapaiensis]PYE47937.1 putative delta-60 repeat protein [Deinococcus yavapaiensis KR-236]